MQPNTGLEATSRADIASALGKILDSTYSLMVRTHLYHWNVRGPLFEPLHQLLEQQYGALFEAVDEIAERIQQLGFRAPSTGGQTFPTGVSQLQQETGARAMIEDLLGQHESACRQIREAGIAADEAGDLVTNDLLSEKLGFHEKAAWMLRATLVGWQPRADETSSTGSQQPAAMRENGHGASVPRS